MYNEVKRRRPVVNMFESLQLENYLVFNTCSTHSLISQVASGDDRVDSLDHFLKLEEKTRSSCNLLL
jgi:hypothetical protein